MRELTGAAVTMQVLELPQSGVQCRVKDVLAEVKVEALGRQRQLGMAHKILQKCIYKM